MLVDKSHSKNDIIKLFNKVEVDIDKKQSKGHIINNIENYFEDCKFNKEIKNLTEMKTILQNENLRQRPNLEEKNIIMFKCKKIVKWATCNYIYDSKTYNSINEVYNDILFIYKWGDIPSVRKALWKLKNHPINKFNYEPTISKQTQAELDRRNLIKNKYPKHLTLTHGKFLINFD